MFSSDRGGWVPALLEIARKVGVMVQHELAGVTDTDLHLFHEGTHSRLYEKLGAHIVAGIEGQGTHFTVWAPNAEAVSVIGDFNRWDRLAQPLQDPGNSGIWEGFVPGVQPGAMYKYSVQSRYGGYRVDKADPFAFFCETPPKTASIVWDLGYEWQDSPWMQQRRQRNALDSPVSIYEIHLGSWRCKAKRENRFLSYRQLAQPLAEYVEQMGFTHVEFLPIMEHPFYGSWGYQTTAYFAPSARYGTPQDFMYLVDYLHRHGIGVILDWVPSHFPDDEHGLGFFDGTHLYEHEEPGKRIHPEWDTFIFNYGRNEVRSFLYSSALFWLDKYHADGLRLDAVASMLYLDFGREGGRWIPNEHGGRENLAAVEFLRQLNRTVYGAFPSVTTLAEESTAWPLVSRPTHIGGLGFGYKWDMGWMHDTLEYMSKNPVFRKFHHNLLTFRIMYAFSENFILPLSHDEMVYGKSSLLNRMPGDAWQKFANLRLLLGYMYGQAAKKLLFMGGEFGQWREWLHDGELDWQLLEEPPHQGVQRWVADLNRLYANEKALHELDCESGGFEWIDANDIEHSVISFIRKGRSGEQVIVLCNFTPVTHFTYRVGVPQPGFYRELLNSDAKDYGGSGQGNMGGVEASPVPLHHRPYSLTLNLPPLATLFLKPQ